jgi:hypothetical protein
VTAANGLVGTQDRRARQRQVADRIQSEPWLTGLPFLPFLFLALVYWD